MQLWFLISIGGVLFGYVACDPECYQKKADECRQEETHYAPDDPGLSFCSFTIKHQKCLIEAARECKMNFEPELEKVLYITEEICKPGSELYQEHVKVEECLKIAEKDSKCSKFILQIDENDKREKAEIEREACKLYEKRFECYGEQVRDTCGRIYEAFYHFILGPGNKFILKLCDEVIIPLSEKGKRSMDMDLQNVFRSLGLF